MRGGDGRWPWVALERRLEGQGSGENKTCCNCSGKWWRFSVEKRVKRLYYGTLLGFKFIDNLSIKVDRD